MAQLVKNPPEMRETQVRSLGEEDPLEKGMATCSSILAWKIPWTEEPGTLQSMGVTRVRHDLVTKPPPLREHDSGRGHSLDKVKEGLRQRRLQGNHGNSGVAAALRARKNMAKALLEGWQGDRSQSSSCGPRQTFLSVSKAKREDRRGLLPRERVLPAQPVAPAARPDSAAF